MTGLDNSALYQKLRPADRVVALAALKAAIEQELAKQKQLALAVAEEVGVKSFNTRFGALNVVAKDAPILINEFALFDWVKVHAPENIETIEQVKPWFAKQLSDPERFIVVGDDVFDANGEDVPYAQVGQAAEPYISWASSKEQKLGKQIAEGFVRGHLEELSTGVLELTEGN